ncbi:MAG TPA: transposase [Polyangia bacterium]|nr:transposase [Polyangia bacterium]
MSKTFRPYSPGQAFLLPPSPLDWLPEDHLARFIMDVVKKLDLAVVYQRYEGDLRGYPPYHPQMMVALLLYGYCVGVPSSWKIEKKTHEDIAFRVIAGGAQPDHSSVSEFRRVHPHESVLGVVLKILVPGTAAASDWSGAEGVLIEGGGLGLSVTKSLEQDDDVVFVRRGSR